MKQKIIMFYPCGTANIFSGMRIATEILLKELIDKEWDIVSIHTPIFNRIREADQDIVWLLYEYLNIIIQLLITWLRGFIIAFSRDIIYVNPGQSIYGLLRDGFPLLVRSLIHYNNKSIVSIHGNVFLQWKKNNIEYKLFQRIADVSKYITVLGPTHKQKLLEMGIGKEKIILMDNTTLLPPLPEKDIIKKHQAVSFQLVSNNPIKILYLSFLMEPKGYVEYVEAINNLATSSFLPIEAYLCGQIKMGENYRLSNYSEAKSWIENRVSLINQSNSVKLYWVNSVFGEDKVKLFHEAHIFVLPSRFRMEAQPISMIEALASGCAVITTQVGEIPSTVNEKTALFLNDTSPANIVKAISELCENHVKRLEIALNGLRLFQERFSYKEHIKKWEKLLNSF